MGYYYFLNFHEDSLVEMLPVDESTVGSVKHIPLEYFYYPKDILCFDKLGISDSIALAKTVYDKVELYPSESSKRLFASFLYQQTVFMIFLSTCIQDTINVNGTFNSMNAFGIIFIRNVLRTETALKIKKNTLKNLYIIINPKNYPSIVHLRYSFLRAVRSTNYFLDKFIDNAHFYIGQILFLFVLDLVKSTFLSGKKKESLKYFPFFFYLFLTIFSLNSIGLIPYSATVTSSISVTLLFTMVVLFSSYYLAFSIHGLKFFQMFCPQGCPFELIFFLIPIEFISYIFRMVSLSARLFANMMAGHALLAVLTGFSWVMFHSSNSSVALAGVLPMIVVFLLFFLETGIAIVQAIVFTILSCMYLDEAITLAH